MGGEIGEPDSLVEYLPTPLILDSLLLLESIGMHAPFVPKVFRCCATSINQNRNTLMPELDRLEGVVIMTTNLFGNYDEGLLRRVQRHIQFRLPNLSMRRELFALHLPNPERVKANLRTLAKQSRGLSDGDIVNICLNALPGGGTAMEF